MTVLIGVLSENGVVIGADSHTTFSAGPFRTIEQDTRKIEIFGGNCIVACTGSVGLAQRFGHVVDEVKKSNIQIAPGKSVPFEKISYIDKGKVICQNVINNLAQTHLNQSIAIQQQNFGLGALVALESQGKLHLCEFESGNLQPEFKNENLWYVSMGSGQTIADPFLAFFREVFWDSGMPKSVPDAIFAVAWTLRHTIRVNPGGVGGEPSVAVLERVDNTFKARLLDKGEIQEHLDSVDGAVEKLREYAKELRSEGKEVPAVPDLE